MPSGDPDRPSELDSAGLRASQPCRRPGLQLERRSPALLLVRRHRYLRGACQGLHHEPPRGPSGSSWHLRRSRSRGGHRPPGRPRGHGSRAAPGPPQASRSSSSSTGGSRITGATTPSVFSLLTRPTRPQSVLAGRGARWQSSRRWSTPFTVRGSKSSSTSCSTTPPRATTWAPRCASGASTTRPTTGWSPEDRRYYVDDTGCGNTVNAGDPLSLYG